MNLHNIDSFKKNGFIIIEDVISTKDVHNLRKKLFSHFSSNNRRMETISYILKNRDIYSLQFREKLVKTLKKVLGNNFSYVNDLQMQYNMFGVKGGTGWHIDSGGEFYDGKQYLFSDSNH